MSFNIFISYSTRDVEIIKPLVKQLSLLEEIKIFFADKTINPGDKISHVIINNIKRADLFIVFHSEFAKDSSYVQQEIGAAVSNEKIVIPVLLDSTKPTGMLTGINYLNLCKPEKQGHELKRLHNFLIAKVQSKKERDTLWLVIGALATLGLVLGLCSYLDSRDKKKRKTEKKEKQEPIIETDFPIYDAVYEVTPEVEFKETEIGKIPVEWDIIFIDEIKSDDKSSLAMGPFGSNIKSENFVDEGVPVIRGNNLRKFEFNEDDFVFLTESKADELKSSNAFKGDIVITHRGTLGQVGIIPYDSKFDRYVVSQSQMKLKCNTNIVNPYFVYYFLNSRIGQYLLLMNKSQTGVPAIAQPLTSLKKVPIPVPDKDEQDKIVNILFDIDQKIETNRQINQVLEKIGHKLFKQWFVDFEFPDGEGNPYKSNGGEFDSELGIPNGWRFGKLSDVCEIVMGQSPPSKTYNENGEGLPFYQGIKDFGFRFPERRIYCVEPKKLAEKGDVLLSVRAPVGTLNVADEKCALGRGIAALRLKEKHNGFLYYFMCFNQHRWNIFESEGTVFGAIKKSDIHEFEIAIPDKNLISKFGKIVDSIDYQINLNEKENRYLTKIRDKLLPKLMSGEIRV
ncbi:MAG: restriction endonuclease subunit S [Methanosarcinaceae archaeon]